MDDVNNNHETPEPEETPERPDIPEFVASRTVGDMLANERRRQGKTLADVADSTNIRLRMLQSLEDGNYDYLPSEAYVRGYIQNYATVLNLSPEPFLEAYRQEAPRDDEPEMEGAASLRDPILPKRDQAHAIPPRLLWGILAFFVVVGLIWLTLTLVGGGDEEPAPLPPPIEEEAPSDTTTEAVPGVTDDSVEATPEPDPSAAQAFEMTVSVEDADASWLRVTIDGEKVYEGTLPGGESRSWEVTELASVRIGRPSVVTIMRDGEVVPIPSTGELPTIELAADD